MTYINQLGLKQEALNEFESLYLRTDRIDILYTISQLQFELGDFNQSLNNLDILLKNDDKVDEIILNDVIKTIKNLRILTTKL